MNTNESRLVEFELLSEVTQKIPQPKKPKKTKSKSEAVSVEGHRSRLRQRFLQAGFNGFADHEKIELILTLCIPRRDVKPAAKLLLHKFGTLRGILDASPKELQTIEGIGSVAPVALKIIKETATVYLQEESEEKPLLNGVDKLIEFWRMRLGGLKHEVFEVGFLDNQYYLMKNGVERLEEGIVDRANVYPRKVMEAALRRQASNIVIVHNHPTGVLEASEADIRLTKALVQAGKAVGVTVIEHLIITADDAFSFCSEDLL